MPKRERKFFLCTGQCVPLGELVEYPLSHILGELTFVSDEGRRVTALALWEVPLPTRNYALLESGVYERRVRLKIVGDARDIECRYSGCQNLQRWEIGKAAFLQLTRRYQVRVPTVEGV